MPQEAWMYNTVVVLILLFPWTILGVMAIGTIGRRLRLRKVAIRSH